jgi:hypothetical protein
MEILDKILLTELVVSLVSLCSMAVGINSKLFVISRIVMLISLISFVVTLLIVIWMV